MKSFSIKGDSQRKELNIRKELNSFMMGSIEEIPKGQLYILRIMRPKEGIEKPISQKELITCGCKTAFENEPELDYRCPICDGEGYTFDDHMVPGYKTNRFEYQDIEKYMPFGKNTSSMSFFYIEYFDYISKFDKILEPKTDQDGKLTNPIKVIKRHNIHHPESFRGDTGRVEFYRLSCYGE